MTKTDKFLDMFKGLSGGYDTARILFGIGGLNGVIAPVVFQVWAFIRGQSWDAVSFCTGYGIMLSGIIAAGGFGIRQKDKGVADAQATMSTTENG
jgi:hypothetical protein